MGTIQNAYGLMSIFTAQTRKEEVKENRKERRELRDDVCLHDDTKKNCSKYVSLCLKKYRNGKGAKNIAYDEGEKKVTSFSDCLKKAPVFGATVKDVPTVNLSPLTNVSKVLGRAYEKRNELILPKGLSKNDVIEGNSAQLKAVLDVRKNRIQALKSIYRGVAKLVYNKEGLNADVSGLNAETKNLKTWADYDLAEESLQSMINIAREYVGKANAEKFEGLMAEKTGWFESQVDQVRGSVATKKGPLHDRNRFIESFDEYVGNISEGRTVLQQYCSAETRFEVAKAIHHYAARYCLIPKTVCVSRESVLVEKQEQVADYSKRSMSGGPGTRTETKQVREERCVDEVKICDNYDRDHIAKVVSRRMKSTCEKPELWELEERPDFKE